MAAFGGPNTDETRVGVLNGLFKEIYADNLENLLPKGLKLQKDIAWIEKSKSPGGTYHQPVLLQHEHGFTYAAASSGAFALNRAVPGKTADTTILGTQMMLRSQIDYEVAARASSAGKRTFRKALDIVVENMFASTRKRMECDYFYGQDSLAQLRDDTPADTDASPGQLEITSTGDQGDSTSHDDTRVQFSDATWAPGLWAGMEGAKVTAHSDSQADAGGFADNVQTTPSGTTGGGSVAVEYRHDEVTVHGVNLNNRTVDFGAPAASAAGTDTTYQGEWQTSSDSKRPTYFAWNGAWDTSAQGANGATPNVFKGMKKIMNAPNDPLDTDLFGLNSATHSLWQGNVATGVGAMGFDVVANQIAVASAKGLDENLILYLNPLVWTDLILQEQQVGSAQRIQWPGNNKGQGYDLGGTDVRFHTANGVVNIKPSNFVKIGDGFLFAPKLWKRIGATDLTFRLPDRGDEFFLHLPENAGYELRNYVSHALFTKAPAKSVLLTGITIDFNPAIQATGA